MLLNYSTDLIQRRTRECCTRKFTTQYSRGSPLVLRDYAKFFSSQGILLARQVTLRVTNICASYSLETLYHLCSFLAVTLFKTQTGLDQSSVNYNKHSSPCSNCDEDSDEDVRNCNVSDNKTSLNKVYTNCIHS